MKDLNSFSIIGRISNDPELKDISGGNVVNFSLAYNTRKKDNGGWKDEANFIDCDYWGKSAAAVYPYLKKGGMVSLVGELIQSKWQDNSGNNKSKHILKCMFLQLLGGGGKRERPSNRSNNEQYNERYDNNRKETPSRNLDDDIPY